MPSYREIVTKAVVGRGKKVFSSNHEISLDINPTTILGCWVINHSFSGEKINNEVFISGSFDVNLWYSNQENTSTEVVKDSVKYKEKINVKMSDDKYDGNDEIIVRTLKQPVCVKAEIVDGMIKYVIEKEFAVEVVGDVMINVGINDDVVSWDESDDNLEKEITDSLNEKFL